MKSGRLWVLTVLLTAFSCRSEEDPGQLLIMTIDSDFNIESVFDGGPQGWTGGFADFPANKEDSSAFELEFAYTEPIESKLSKRSIMLSGNNLNQDLFMYIKRKVENLKPNTDYTITFNVELTSDLRSVEHLKGGSVYLKAGATHREPKSVIDGDQYVMNLDKGNEHSSGEDMVTLGNLVEDGTGTAYSLITRSNTMANSRYVARTNSIGELWLIVGTDSSVSGTTKIFYTRVKALLSVS